MAAVSRIQLCVSLFFLFYLLASSLIIPYDGQQPQRVAPTDGKIFLGTALTIPADNCPRNNPDVSNGTLIDQLWRQNCDLVNAFLDNSFTTLQARSDDGPEVLKPFQYYSLQDYYYIVETVQHKAFLMETRPPLGSNLASQISDTVKSMESSLEYAQEFRTNLTQNLNITEKYINGGSLHAAGLGYVKWLQESTKYGWFGFQVARAACVYGWAEIAYKLNKSPETKINTVFYENWVQLNLDWSYGSDLSKKFEVAVEFYNNSQTFPVYTSLFRQGLLFEIALFESAMNKTLENTN